MCFMRVALLQECPAGTFKNATGSDRALCRQCPLYELPHRAVYIAVRGISILMIHVVFDAL